MSKHTFFNQITGTLEPIPGRVYWVSLPICGAIPSLRESANKLIAYRSINPRYKKDWTVSHAETGCAIAYGETKKAAMKEAQYTLLRVGNERFLKTVEFTKSKILSLNQGENNE